jgi:hypothetical protein
MDVNVHGPGPSAPFLSARDRFETEYALDRPVAVHVREDPDERTWTGHHDDRHVLNISRQAATSAMATELALHEFAHMLRHEQGHPSHTQSTEEAIYLALAGHSVEQRKLTHCYQIANHMKDIYADDVTVAVGRGEKLVSFLEAGLAGALADHAGDSHRSAHQRLTAVADPEITAVNAAFALGLVERHDLVEEDHRLYDLAHAAAQDAPRIALDEYKDRFRSLARDPGTQEYRHMLVSVTKQYATGGPQAAD